MNTFLFLLAVSFTASSVLPVATSIRIPLDKETDFGTTFDVQQYGAPDTRRTFDARPYGDDQRFAADNHHRTFDDEQFGEADSRRTFDEEQFEAADNRRTFDDNQFGTAHSGNTFDAQKYGEGDSSPAFEDQRFGAVPSGNTFDGRQYGPADSGNKLDGHQYGAADSGNRFDSRQYGAANSVNTFGGANSRVTFNVLQYGARGDGATENSKAFLAAWNAACSSAQPSRVYIPKGNFLLDPAVFTGACKSNSITVQLKGNLIQRPGTTGPYWLQFQEVDGLTIHGRGHLDGQGASWWNFCIRNGQCKSGTATLRLAKVTNGVVRGITSINSKQFHITIDASDTVLVEGVTIQAPADSPNTDGIHIDSHNVHLRNINIATGDDCVACLEGTTNLLIENIKCGPGHGISVGSLGRYPSLDGVSNVTVDGVTFYGTQNGIRIKTLQGGKGSATGFIFKNIVMNNVQNPIVIDQHYCPACGLQKSFANDNSPNVKISSVLYKNITGTSTTKEAINFGCSNTVPCEHIQVEDIHLTFGESEAVSLCNNAKITGSISVNPPLNC